MMLALICLLLFAREGSSCTKFVRTHTVYTIQLAAYRPSPLFYTIRNSNTVLSLNESFYGQTPSKHFWFLTHVAGTNNTYRIYNVFSHNMVWTAYPDAYNWDVGTLDCSTPFQLIRMFDTVDGPESNACILAFVVSQTSSQCSIYQGDVTPSLPRFGDCNALSDTKTLQSIPRTEVFYFDEVQNGASYDLYGGCLTGKQAQCQTAKLRNTLTEV